MLWNFKNSGFSAHYQDVVLCKGNNTCFKKIIKKEYAALSQISKQGFTTTVPLFCLILAAGILSETDQAGLHNKTKLQAPE